MAGKCKEMSTIKQVIRLHMDGMKNREIARVLGIYKGTVNKYVSKAEADTMSKEELLSLDDPVLERRMNSGKLASPDRRFDELSRRLDHIVSELSRPKSHLTLYQLWKEYSLEVSDHYGYTQFCFHVGQHRKASSLSFVMSESREGGRELYVDFAGDTMSYVDVASGEVVPMQVFVATLPASDYGFAMAVRSQRVEDFLFALESCLRHIGGAPRIIVTDNLKAAVTKSDRYQPEISRVMEDFCNHHGCSTVPCRAYKPKDKSLVENMVKLVYRHVFAPLRNTVLYSEDELNNAIEEKMSAFNAKRMAQIPCTREERFLATDKPRLGALNPQPFEIRSYTTLKVADNSHFYLGRDRHYYSVPYRLIGQCVKVEYTRTLVAAYHEGEKVALHKRDMRPGRYSTKAEHMPSYYNDYARRSPQRYIDRAAAVSQPLADVVAEIFRRNPSIPPETFYKSCDGLLHLAKTTDRGIMDKACAVALQENACTYKFINNLVRSGCRGVERECPDLFRGNDHANLRDSAYYRKALAEDSATAPPLTQTTTSAPTNTN